MADISPPYIDPAPPISPPLPASPPVMPPYMVTWCDPKNYDVRGQELDGPCLHGLSWWIWLLLILGACCCLVPIGWKLRGMAKQGITPGRIISFWEAVMLANHAVPSKSRLGGRPMRGMSPLDDLIQAQNCCCCLSLRKGLVLLGLVDLARLGVHLAYAIDSIGIYQQTEVPQLPNADPRLAGLMDQELRRLVLELAIATIIVAGTKVLLWVVMWSTSLTMNLINPLRALMAWAPVELVTAIAATVVASTLNRDVCLVDISIYNATGWHSGGFVGFRRNYLETLPDDRFEPLRTLNVPEVGPVAAACEAFWFHELLFQIIDVVVCAFLLVYTIYIGYSHTQAVLSGDFLSTGLGPRGSGKRGVRV